jgi:hypothetical protein
MILHGRHLSTLHLRTIQNPFLMLTSVFFSLSSLQCTLQTIVVECFVSCCVVLFLYTNQITTHHNTRTFTEKYAESSSLLARQTAYDNNQECVLPIVPINTHLNVSCKTDLYVIQGQRSTNTYKTNTC